MWRFTREKFEMLIFVVPLTFAESLTGKNPSRLKLLSDAFYDVEIIQKVDPESFYPKPKTESALIKILPKEGNFFLREFFIQYLYDLPGAPDAQIHWTRIGLCKKRDRTDAPPVSKTYKNA